MSSKAGGKRPATITSEPSNHTMVSEVPPERTGVRVGAQSHTARQAAVETGCRGSPRGLSGSSPPLQASRSSRKGIAFGKRSNSMKRNPNAAVTKSGWLYKQVPEPPLCRVPPWGRAAPSPGGCCSHCPSPAGQLGGEAVEQALVRAGGSLPLLLQRYGSKYLPWVSPAACPPRQDLVAKSQVPPHANPGRYQTQSRFWWGLEVRPHRGAVAVPTLGTQGVNAGAFPSLPGSSMGSVLAGSEDGHE